MEILEISKVLSNKSRIEILRWLKKPQDNFPPHEELKHFDDGVCVQYIQKKANLSQSTVSHYLSQLERVGLVRPTRHGKWTYYKRNEETVQQYLNLLNNEL